MAIDRARIAADDATAAAFAAQWCAPAALVDAVAQCSGDEAADAQRMVALFADPAWLTDMLSQPLRMIAAAPLAQPPLRGSGTWAGRHGLMLARGGHVAVTLAVQPPGPDPATLLAGGRVVVSRVLRTGGARWERWACDPRHAHRIAPATSAATAGPEHPLVLDGARHALRPVGQSGVAVTLSATLAARPGAVARHYDAATGRLLRTTAAGEAGSRMRMLLALLEAAGDPDGGATFADATDDADPAVRWAAMRAWLRHDALAAQDRLAAMATTDGDDAVRAAAAATLGALHRRLAA